MVKPTHLNPSYIAPSAWWEHVPLAHWLIETLQPCVVVELGSHYGVSFFAFCQAAKQLSPQSFIFAVDTWNGDEHAGTYEDSIYQQVFQHQATHYSQNSALIRQKFDDALTYFADASIDLLHIDGLHTYDAVKHDFNTWQPKLTANGTILFHDINVRERDFGVWKLWHEIKQGGAFHCLEVSYGSGLGIATQGPDVPGWHQEFRDELEDFQSRGALFLELAGKHLALLEAHQANHHLSIELAGIKTQLEAAQQRLDQEAQNSPDLEFKTPASDPQEKLGRSRLARLKTTLKARTKQVLQRRYSLAALISKAKRKSSRLIRLQQAISPTGFEQLTVVFISGEAHTPGHLYRVKRLAAAYGAIGASVTILTPQEINTNLGLIAGSNILSLWRIAWSAELAEAIAACRTRGGQVVFDVDDLMIRPELAKAEVIDGIRSNRFDEAETAKLFERMQQTMLAADICVTTTQELAAQMRLFGKPVFVIPNGYDEPTFNIARLAYRKRQQQAVSPTIRLGYASGSLTHQKDFSFCYAGVVNALRRHPNCKLVLYRDGNDTPCLEIREFPELASLADQIEWRRLVAIEDLPAELARFDINIIPLETGNVFTESKSELKFFEAALAGVCSIASPTGPYRRAIRHGKNGLLASTAEEWEQHLECLITNPDLRRQYAQTALADTLFAYGPVRRTQQIATLATYLTQPVARGVVFQSLIREETSRTPTAIDIPPFELVLNHDQLGTASVTVVIPLFNYERYIVEALDSVKNQTLSDIDLIVVDDRSTDGSLAVAREWLERNRHRFNRTLLALNRENSKLGPTRNVGFHLAETEYVFALDADNRLAPECLQRCTAMARERKPAYVYPTLEEFGATKGMIGNLEYTPMKLVGGNYIDAMALVSKAAWLHVGGYRNIRHGWEDYELWCRFAEAGLTAAHAGSVPLAYYRVHAESMLRTTTDAHDNKQELIGTMQGLHPWLQISTPPENETSQMTGIQSEQQTSFPGSAVTARQAISTILPILRCPSTQEPLLLADGKLRVAGRDELVWPLIDGAPNLFAGLDNPMIKDEQHISHPLPGHIQSKIRETPGWVLNLSAGGSQQKPTNVIEVEFALFRHTDVIADAHNLPFAAETFEGIVCMNAFEHYHDPHKVASELLRVLKPGGWLVVQTAFLQPEHEYPWHFYNTTSEGLKLWFQNFDIDIIRVSDNFNPLYALSWLASQCEASLRGDVSTHAADRFKNTPVKTLIEGWNQGSLEKSELWSSFQRISQEKQRAIAAGFELLAHKPANQTQPSGEG